MKRTICLIALALVSCNKEKSEQPEEILPAPQCTEYRTTADVKQLHYDLETLQLLGQYKGMHANDILRKYDFRQDCVIDANESGHISTEATLTLLEEDRNWWENFEREHKAEIDEWERRFPDLYLPNLARTGRFE